ncbi:MAG TPA: hypothetical protein VFS43_24710 [Polyangiaceae bacterium]|nr:hypothetical protein [Polyangiaceae bacterium]
MRRPLLPLALCSALNVTACELPTLAPETTGAYAPIALGYGLGWATFESPFGRAFFKEGHD